MGEVRQFPVDKRMQMLRATDMARDRRDMPGLRAAFADPVVATIDHAITECDRIGVDRRVRAKLCEALALAMFDHLSDTGNPL